MAELPEIAKLAGQMDVKLKAKTIDKIILLQEKCANISPEDFQSRVANAVVENTYYKGKWIITRLSNGENILLSLGMGADILYFEDEASAAEKYQIKVCFHDGTGYTSRFWWFGKFLLVSDTELITDENTKEIAMNPFDENFTYGYFQQLLSGKKTQIKAFLMNQKNIGGIGNMYMHDMLFKARLHPQKKIATMDETQIEALYMSIVSVLNLSREKGSFAHEKDFYGNKGCYDMADILIGYKENMPCPVCKEAIVSIKTGSTSSFICPNCQSL